MPDALTLLDREWDTYRISRRAASALLRWRAAAAVPAVADVDSLMLAMQDRDDPDGRDRLVYRLCVMASADRDACLVVLAAVRPGLNRVAQNYRRWWGWEETSSMTFAAALERVVTYPATRRERPAANIVLDVQNRLHRARLRDLTEATRSSQVTDEELATVPSSSRTSPSEELIDVVHNAVNTLRLSKDEADLIVRQRVLDVATERLAAERGHRPGTVRTHRRKAERRLTLITRASYNLNPAVA